MTIGAPRNGHSYKETSPGGNSAVDQLRNCPSRRPFLQGHRPRELPAPGTPLLHPMSEQRAEKLWAGPRRGRSQSVSAACIDGYGADRKWGGFAQKSFQRALHELSGLLRCPAHGRHAIPLILCSCASTSVGFYDEDDNENDHDWGMCGLPDYRALRCQCPHGQVGANLVFARSEANMRFAPTSAVLGAMGTRGRGHPQQGALHRVGSGRLHGLHGPYSSRDAFAPMRLWSRRRRR